MIGVADAPGRVSLSNIGCNGENLTIAVLSMNRADVTIRLMDSIAQYIPNFAGEFLIGDNGSSEDQKQILLDQMKRMPSACRLLDFGRNYGVSGGRNRTFREVKTDWLLSSDNDMYFIGNPLPKIQRDIQTLGCHFLNVPILNKEKQMCIRDRKSVPQKTVYLFRFQAAGRKISRSAGALLSGVCPEWIRQSAD